MGVEGAEALGRQPRLAPAEVGRAVERLAGEVAAGDDIPIAEAQLPDACPHQQRQEGGAQSARPDDRHPRAAEALLSLQPELGEEELPLVALAGLVRPAFAPSPRRYSQLSQSFHTAS